MKKVKKPVFFIVFALIVFLTYTSVFGLSYQRGEVREKIIKGANDIRWGIDIRGGIDVTFRAEDRVNPTLDQLHQAKEVINARLANNNITDSQVFVDEKNYRIIVRYPWHAEEKEFDPEKAIEELSATALLTLREGIEYDEDGNPKSYENFPVVLSGNEVVNAEAGIKPGTAGQYVVFLTLSEEGKKKFSEATKKLAPEKGIISIWLDDMLLSAPAVQTHIEEGECYIESSEFTAATAKKFADTIKAGTIPFKLVTDGSSAINPELGESARDNMVFAGLIAFLIVCLFMIIVYRLPGLIASIALLGQIAGSIACISGYFPFIPSFTLTIPGIAGIILSIGMGVDANIITYERMKEEFKAGKTIDAAIDSGAKNSFSAIFDGNITLIIVSIILMGVFGSPDSFFAKLLSPFLFMFGPAVSGAISSFGFTLLIGVIFNFLMAVTASRLMLKSISRFKPFRKVRLYGGVEK